MKNVVIAILLLATAALGYNWARSWRLPIGQLAGTKSEIIRGDLTIPINATGEIRPSRRIEIKAEASGEVIDILKRAGERVKAGDLIMALEPDEEKRTVNRAKLDLEVAKARLKTSEVSLQQARTSDLIRAQSSLAQLVESLRYQAFLLEKVENLPADVRNVEEQIRQETSYLSQKAQVESARADVERAKMIITQAEQDLIQSQAAHETAGNNLADAEKRLTKTKIVSPINGIIGDVKVQIGEVIQGGKTTLTGGTVLAIVLQMDRLIVKTEVDESDIGRILNIAPQWARPGNDGSVLMPTDLSAAVEEMENQPVVTVESFRDEEFTGIVERIYPEPTNINNVRTYIVDVVITSATDRLLPGMRADVMFTSEHIANATLCPNEAIHEGSKGQLGVYVPKLGAAEEDRATTFIPCKFGLDNGNYSEILCDELTANMTVYTKLPIKPDRDNKRKQS
jgi:multidrug efflux pump subunit AcrA (membrane-fusion protein)